MELVKNYSDLWDETMRKYSDPRTSDWFMMSSFTPSVLICFAYVIIVQFVLPVFMENRKAFDLKNWLIVYNFLIVLMSVYIFTEFLFSGWLDGYSLKCQPVDYSNSPMAQRMARVCWLFYMSKFIELIDTVFFVLRKKYNQVTFLHVFHHGTMPLNWWFAVKFVPGGHGTFHAMLNSFVHILMYSYYGVSALGPKYQKYLFWKKYMTTIQMVQFAAVFIHALQLWFIKCDFPKVFVIWIMTGASVFMAFFANFYIHEYIIRRGKPSAIKSKQNKDEISTNDNDKKNF